MLKRDPIAFLSYVRSDDDHDNGNISKLRERLEGELKVQLGKSFTIFQDRNDIKWGQQWQARIEKSILDVTFLIPVITPSFFNSPACRKEFSAFHLKEKQYGFNHLILPFYYVDCDQLAQDFPQGLDALADVIRARQWSDWRTYRFKQLLDPDAAAALARMAREIKAAMIALEVELDAELHSRAVEPKKMARQKRRAPSAKDEPLIVPSEPFSADTPEGRRDERFDLSVLKKIRSKPYYVYTKRFDEVIRPIELTDPDELGKLQKFLIKAIGKLPPPYLKTDEQFSSSAAITLLLDNSGSLRGAPIMHLAACVTLLMEWLEDKGALVEVLGFTTRSWKGGQSREMWMSDGKPKQPGRLNDIRHVIYKSFSESVREVYSNFGLMAREGLLKENFDGEALLWAYSRIREQKANRKLIVLFSDGEPVDDSTLSVNRSTFLVEHLRFVIEYIQKTNVRLLTVGPHNNVHSDVQQKVLIGEFALMGNSMVDIGDKIRELVN